MTLAFGAVAATCATTAALRVGLPPMASLHTRGVSWSQPAAAPTRLEAPRPLGASPKPRLASLGAGVDPQVPLPGGASSADRPAAGAGIYQPDWDEIDLGDDFRGVADEVEESDGAAGRSDGSFQRRFERPERAPRLEARRPSSSLGGSGSYPYEDDGSIPWTRRLIPGYRGGREENRAMDDLVERDSLALERDDAPRDLDTFEGAFGDENGVLANAPRLRSLDRASRDAESAERAWDADEREKDEKESQYEDAYENGLDARQEITDGDAYEASFFGDLDASYADAERAERTRRVKIARQREHARDVYAYEKLREAHPDGVKSEKTRTSEASLGAARRGGEGGGSRTSTTTNAGSPEAYFDYDDPDYVSPGLIPVPRPLTDYDYAPYDYGGDYDYYGAGARRGDGAGARGRGRGRRRGGDGDGVSGSPASRASSRGSRGPGSGHLGMVGDGPRLGVPGLAQHIAYAGDGVGASETSTRVLLSVRPGEWGLAYLQLASLKRTSPQTLAHITVLTYDRATRSMCAALGNGRDEGVDCFLDEAFLETWSDALDALDSEDPKSALGDALHAALSWRKVHAAFELLQQNTPVVLLDADVVFLKDPTPTWRDAMRRYDVAVAANVGDEEEAQRNADTSVALFPATPKTKELVREWLKGESVPMMDTDRQKDNGGDFPDPARTYFNDALVPVVAHHARVHGLDAKAFANFLTAHRGADGAFDGVVAVSGGFCSDLKAKELFLRSTLEEKARAEKDLAGEEAAPGRSAAALGRSASRDDVPGDGDGDESAEKDEHGASSSSSAWVSKSAKSAARRAARIVERKKARAEKRAKGLPLISSVDTQTHAAAVGVSGGDIGLDAGSENSDWPPVNLACDVEKRKAAFRGEYRVTDERRVVWEL